MNLQELLRQYDLLSPETKLLEMNDNGDFDLDMSQTNLKVDEKTIWHKKEKSSIKSLNKLLSCLVELKSMDKTLFTFFIEYQIEVNGQIKDSGILTTKSDLYRITIDELVFEVPTLLLKWIYSKHDSLNINKGKVLQTTSTNYIGYGIYIPVSRLLELYHAYKCSDEYRRIIHLRLKK